eukprot:SAG11_NODE_2559_length_3220_cov_3.037808_2_plen_98_part_00
MVPRSSQCEGAMGLAKKALKITQQHANATQRPEAVAVLGGEQPFTLSPLESTPRTTRGEGGSGIAWRAGDKDPDYYWADATTGEIKCTKHCLWEEVK